MMSDDDKRYILYFVICAVAVILVVLTWHFRGWMMESEPLLEPPAQPPAVQPLDDDGTNET